MIRTGTVALSRIAFLAALVISPSLALAQRSTSTAQTGGWESHDNAAAATWKPTRQSEAPTKARAKPQAAAAQKKWLAPNQTSRPTKSAASQPQPAAKKVASAAREPKPFTPPADAQQLSAAPRPKASQSAAITKSQSVARSGSQSQSAARPTQRMPQQRVANRHQPVSPANRPSFTDRLMDDTWIGSLRQVAYQEGEPEELYAPQGEELPMPMSGGPMMGPSMEGEWIGSPGGCCDGSCGPSCDCGPGCDCGPMCGDGIGGCSSCGHEDGLDLCTVGPHDDDACDTVRVRVPKFQELMIFGGVHGFKGPYDRQRDPGNFGFQEGFNIGAKLPFVDAGYQVGYQAQQSQLNGDASTGVSDAFSQHFFTTGMFKRVRDGFQGGMVWDLLLDERESSVAFSQIRAEFGFVDRGCHEFGVAGSVHLNDNVLVNQDLESFTAFQAVDQYLLYYRMHGERGGEGRVYAGLTDDVDGIIGADFAIPLTDSIGLVPAFTYMIPDSNHAGPASSEEAWNVSIAMVWHWRKHARSCHSSPYRPLLNVADNGYMIIDNRP